MSRCGIDCEVDNRGMDDAPDSTAANIEVVERFLAAFDHRSQQGGSFRSSSTTAMSGHPASTLTRR
jgi:hypothetical protein